MSAGLLGLVFAQRNIGCWLLGGVRSQLAVITSACSTSVSQAVNYSTPSTTSLQGPSTDLPPVKPHLVKQFCAPENLSHQEAFKARKQDLIAQFQRHSGDVGSPEVTIALWTHWIRARARIYHKQPKAFHSMRQFHILANKRRRLLAWLRNTRFDAYCRCISRLGLRDVFGTKQSGDRHLVGVPHGQQPPNAPDAVRRLRFSYLSKYRQKRSQMWKRLVPQLEVEDTLFPKPLATAMSGSVRREQPDV
ncbi:hypothetical protein V8C86DRAFT_2472635 [Haematococcus lacustris]